MLTNKIKALISLLDDSDEIVYGAVRAALLREGDVVIPILRETASNSSSELKRVRAKDLLRVAGLKSVKSALLDWIEDGAEDLLYGAYIVARYMYPNLEFVTVNDAINKMWRMLRRDVKSEQKPLDRVRVVNRFVFEELGFSKNELYPSSPENNFINEVLTKSIGNHVTLSIIYSELCLRIGLPVRCVSLPKILILCYMNDTVMDEDYRLRVEDVMFYINPANKGTIVGREDIKTFLNMHNIELHDNYYLPCDNIEVVRRLLINLHYSYGANKEINSAMDIKSLINIIDEYKDKVKIV